MFGWRDSTRETILYDLEWQKPETQALTGQSEIASPGSLSFLWCSFRVKRIAHFLELPTGTKIHFHRCLLFCDASFF
jgi:hypothetical protein